MRGFRQFLLQGNLVSLAVAFIVGAAFKSLVSALVADFFTPFIGALGGQPDFSALSFTIHGSKFMYGDFVNNVLSFLIVSAVLYFFVVAPYAAMLKRFTPAPTPAPETRACPECLSNIPAAATRCAFCTATVPPVAPAGGAAPPSAAPSTAS